MEKLNTKSLRKGKGGEISFNKHGHFWLDSGLVGLIKTLGSIDTGQVTVRTDDAQLVLSGPLDEIERVLTAAYNYMTENYYNLSTKKQKDDLSSYNFYYDEEKDQFVSFPKRKSMGIAEVIYNKAPRPTEGMVKWEKKYEKKIEFGGKQVKRKRGVLPKEYAHLQERMDKFLDEHGIDVTTSGLLLNGPNAVMPKIKIKLKSSKNKGNCYLCGQPSSQLEEANQTVFPLITGSSGLLSFNSNAGKPEKVCWKCSLLGKFVPVSGFYMYQGNHLFAFLPYSNSLEKMVDTYDLLQEIKYDDPNLYKNFNHPLGPYFQHIFEITFAFLYTLYDKLLIRKYAREEEGDEIQLDLETMYDLTINKAPVEFYVIHAQKEKNSVPVKSAWPFKDTVYFFRLIEKLETETGYRMKSILPFLLDYTESSNEAKSMTRNRVLERILSKRSILDLVEKHVYHADLAGFKPLLDMLLVYENTLKEGEPLFKEEQDAAVRLGRIIGMAVGKSENGKKGDLYALRKTRTMVDFLEQLNRLQFKLGSNFVLPSDLYEGKLTHENFSEFKQFCMIAALNSYYYAVNPKKDKKD